MQAQCWYISGLSSASCSVFAGATDRHFIKLLFLDVGKTLLLWETICLWGYRQADFELREMQHQNQTAWPSSSLCGSVQGISPQIIRFNVMCKIVNLLMTRAFQMVLLVSMLTWLPGPWLWPVPYYGPSKLSCAPHFFGAPQSTALLF